MANNEKRQVIISSSSRSALIWRLLLADVADELHKPLRGAQAQPPVVHGDVPVAVVARGVPPGGGRQRHRVPGAQDGEPAALLAGPHRDAAHQLGTALPADAAPGGLGVLRGGRGVPRAPAAVHLAHPEVPPARPLRPLPPGGGWADASAERERGKAPELHPAPG